jgi:uncharacterized membrane protein (DUF373 family)
MSADDQPAQARPEPDDHGPPPIWERWAATGLSIAEDVLYVGVGVVLVLLAAGLLVRAVIDFVPSLGDLSGEDALKVLSTTLLVLILAELLFTVVQWLRDHVVRITPYLVVALTAAVRRILLITATEKVNPGVTTDQFGLALVELGLLTVLVAVLVALMIWMRRAGIR